MFRGLVVASLITLSSVAAAEPLPIEYFVKDGDYLDVTLSPSGKRLAARTSVDGKVYMLVVDRDKNEIVGGVRPEADSVIHSVDWISDERLVFSYAEDRIGLDRAVATGELFAVDYDGRGYEMLAGYRASDKRTGSRLGARDSDRSSFYLVNALKNDKKHVLVVEYPWSQQGLVYYDNRVKLPIVNRLNVQNGKKRKLEVLPFRDATPFSTSDGKIRFVTYRTEDGLSAAAYRRDDDADWEPLADVFELTEDMIVVGLNEAGDAAFLRGLYGEHGYSTVFRLDFEARSLMPLFTDIDADVASWLADPATGEIIVGKTLRGKPRYHYAETESRMASLHRMLVKAFKGQNVDITSTTDDGRELTVRVSSDTNPGEYYVFDTETMQAEFFWANLSWIDARSMRPMLIDEVETDDGFSIPVRLTLPAAEGPAPLVVHPHGGPHGVADHWAFRREVQLLANRGYAVLQVNFRGSGGFGARFQSAGYRQWGGRMIDDIAAATRWAMQHPGVDGERVCAYGASYGGYAALMLAVREPELLTCTAGYVGVYDLAMMFEKGDIPINWGGAGYLQRVLGTDPVRLDEYSPVSHAGDIQAEVLLIHGDADIRVPIDQAKAMRKALSNAGKAHEWIELNRSGHGAGSIENRLKLYEGLLSFLDAHLKPADRAASVN